MRVVINSCYGGFGLSDKAVERLIELGKKVTRCTPSGHPEDESADFVDYKDLSLGYKQKYESRSRYSRQIVRDEDDCWTFRADPLLVQVVEELGSEADGFCAQLKIIEIPDDVEWEIEEYDGVERVREKSRTWS